MKNIKLNSVTTDIPSTVDETMDIVRAALVKKGFHSLTITADKNIVVKHLPPDKEYIDDVLAEDLSELTPYNVIIRKEMEEFEPDNWGIREESPHTIFFWALRFIEHKKLVPVHIILAENSKFWSWVGLKGGRKKVMGLTVIEDKQVPEFAFIITGAKDRGATLIETSFGLKVNAG